MAEAARVRRRKLHVYGRKVLLPSSIFPDIDIAPLEPTAMSTQASRAPSAPYHEPSRADLGDRRIARRV